MKFARLTDQFTGGTEQSYSNAVHTGIYNSKTRSCRFQWRKLQDHESFLLTGFLNLKMQFEIIDAYGYFLTNCMMSPPTRSSCEGRTGDALVKGLFWSRFHN
ncbi:hypothetical protein ISN45_Aa05g029440 [Arabidopsis thaliana x Arabidopsis arenosa]|uniref:Uncharacterized protein n=1 Tax=Arabidopsis thaliana x Arabidopsis arenosa TaxID=1240361 RepID=A0A8T1ZQ73_9BRAS|nr:hypothetical protein ISN45_Aa05g029440 [Arabidopsis thaliana x Arabidopsis arenosa]